MVPVRFKSSIVGSRKNKIKLEIKCEMQNGMVNTEKQMSSMRNIASSSNTNYVTKVVLIIN